LNLSRPADWRPDPAALKNAARAAIIMPLSFAVATVIDGGEHAPVFAAFGSFALLVFVDFSGRTRPRLLAYIALAIAGAALIVIGTLCSGHLYLSAAVSGFVTFLIFFSGVINGYMAATRTAAVLLIVLPVMIPGGASTIDERLLGWGIACAFSIPAVFLLWRSPWVAELRKGCAAACESIARLVDDPDDLELRNRADESVKSVRDRFLATPHRPTGPTGSAAAVAALIEELEWTVSQFWRAGPSIGDEAGPAAARLREACVAVLSRTAEVIRGREGTVSTLELDQERRDLIQEFSRRVTNRETGAEELETDLARTFRLRLLSFSVADTAGFANVATGLRVAPGPLGKRWLRIIGRQGHKAAATEKLLAEHANPRSAWFRNSFRGGVGIALAVFVALWVDADNAFWVVLGTLSVLRSNAIGTEGSVVSSLIGTVIGIVIGAGVITLIGESSVLLWIALPLAVLGAAYASAAISFTAGQAAFSVLVMILFNLIEPIGVEVGLIRVVDVAIGCAVSLGVGLLLWPRGARELVRRSLGEAYSTAANLVFSRVDAAAAGRILDQFDDPRNEAVAAADRLDAALRQWLDESSAAHVDAESLVALTSCSSRLLRSSHAFRLMVLMPWYRPVPAAMVPQIENLGAEVRDWYIGCGDAFCGEGRIPPPGKAEVSFDDSTLGLIAGARTKDELHAALSGAWVLQGLEYLIYLEGRVAHHADRVFAVDKSEETDLQVG